MVELASYSHIDWTDSAVDHDKTQALKPKSPETRLGLHNLPSGFRLNFHRCFRFSLRSLERYS